ncbi:MAG: 1-acyl-sn-glycerol-3-phosphate acyltransferase [Polyangiaceae bacterium]|nr:1-acyl-sn-glycerol-3-phosphate acyltransferase [Polyangiaceae bacterium]
MRETESRPDLLAAGGQQLTPIERWQIATIRRTFEPGITHEAIRWFQRTVGATWIDVATSRLRTVHGAERLPALEGGRSYVCVANHRSFFDLYVVTSWLVSTGRLRQRILFPVRANFFYDTVPGFFVNGVMSFFAMYPPIFRERPRAPLNLTSLDELTWLLDRGGTFTGIHPEGTRGTGQDPYELLPAQSGVGRILHGTGAVVLPVFVNGLCNDIVRQVRSNFDGTGDPIHIVFGEPLDLTELRARPGSPRTYKLIAERCLDAIRALGAEERTHRGGRGAR